MSIMRQADRPRSLVYKYPTPDQVEAADVIRLGYWLRFLSSPGVTASLKPKSEYITLYERSVLDRICERFNALGGWTPYVSREVNLLRDQELLMSEGVNHA